MAEGKFNGVVDSLLNGMDGFLSTKTVVGQATTIEDTIIVPLIDVSFGIGAGAINGEKKDGGCGGMGAKLSPTAVLVIHEGRAKIVNVKNQDTVTKILDIIPELVDRFKEKGHPSKVKDEEAKEIAFGEK
ncbi:MAG: GerW family sporulation protein [Lachnospiraceae bacterium]|nr:GerW family sporulation protein [Lachnospiraceae bacterium]